MSALKDKGDFRERPHQPPRYELIDKDGKSWGEFKSAHEAAKYAAYIFPDQEQDEERSGRGWDIAVVGADRRAPTNRQRHGRATAGNGAKAARALRARGKAIASARRAGTGSRSRKQEAALSGDSQKLLELAERVEKAERPDRELDGDIAAAMLLHPPGWYRGVKAASAEAMWFRESARDSWRAPDFTASLDAALTLVPEGLVWRVDTMTGLVLAIVCGPNAPLLAKTAPRAVGGKTPALALCAAALRAMAAI